MICTPLSWTQRCHARATADDLKYEPGLGWVMRFPHRIDVLVFTECPYCGGTLPRLRMPNTDDGWLRLWRAIQQADGEGDE